MQIYPTFCTLKEDWVSPRGKLYQAGTTFKRNTDPTYQSRPGTPGYWYNFKSSKNYGIVFIPNKVFHRLTERELFLKNQREEEREKHIRLCEPFRS